jgi:hypothetical protein
VSELPPERPSEDSPSEAPSPSEPGADHPVQLIVKDDLKRSRLTVFFRGILSIPHWFWYLGWSIAVFFVVIVAWFTALFTGRLPDRMHNYLARYLIYATRFTAYANLLANPYPPFNGRPDSTYAVDLRAASAEPQPRWKTLLRYFLAGLRSQAPASA